MTDAPTPLPGTPEWYRAQARRFNSLAGLAILPEIKSQLTKIAREYEDLASQAQKSSGAQ